MEEAAAGRNAALSIISYIHYSYPTLLFVWFAASQAASFCLLSNLRAKTRNHQRRVFVLLQIAIIASYVVEATLMCVHSLVEQGWWTSQDNVIYLLLSILAWGTMEVALLDSEVPVWYPYYGSWALCSGAESALLGLSVLVSNNRPTSFEAARLLVQGFRILILLGMPIALWIVRGKDKNLLGEQSEPLLGVEGVDAAANYGSISDGDPETRELRRREAEMRKKIEETGSWFAYAKSFMVLWPYMWPKNEKRLQFLMALVGLCLLAERGLNVMVPHQLGVVTNALMSGNKSLPWIELSLYVVYRWLDSGFGISALQNYLWMPIDQYSLRSLTTAAYNQVMSLSYDFHSNKKTGEIWSSIAQGRSVNGFIETILFQVAPMLVDLCVAFAYFYILFDVYMALIVAVVSVIYLWVTFKMSTMKSEMRRDLNQSARNEVGILIEAVSSWTTVSYFNRVSYEQSRYEAAYRMYQKAERKWLVGISIIGVTQSMIFTLGLLCASFLAVYDVTRGMKPVGSFVALLSYWAQLSGPLGFFANFFRKIQTQMLDAERLLELFQLKPTVSDKEGALVLDKVEGDVVFENVCFSYDPRKPSIKNLSLHVRPGSTIGLVGETGGGKTTCLKLLFRFYDVESGSIKIDGHDIRDIKLSSLREHLAVVPQDPQLFNDTIMNNIKYANFDTSDEEVYEACRAASIHDKILSFPDGYMSRVGERGVRLSGGELQRVAIARAILKNAKIILLDEATSMIDMETERQIQTAIKRLGQDRTMFVVAHRLSTIMNADQIIVIKDGEIIESGNHDDLMLAGGKYSQLWSKQAKLDDEALPGARPPVIEDLIQMSDPINTLSASKTSGHLRIPGARMDSHRTRGPPVVTFSLPESSVWGPQALPALNPRTIPPHGILKKNDYFKVMPPVEPAKSSKNTSALKPEAKEFIPKSASEVAITAPPQQSPPVSLQPSATLAPPVTTVATQQAGAEVQPDIVVDKADLADEGSNTPKTIQAPAEGVDDTKTPQSEADDPQDTKKRRRRVRRRSQKSIQEPEVGVNGSTPEVVIGASPPVTVAIETQNDTAQSAEGTAITAGASKPKRRFRSGSKLKGNGPVQEVGTNSGSPLAILPAVPNGIVPLKEKPKPAKSTGMDGKPQSKDEQCPADTGRSMQHHDPVSSPKTRDVIPMRAGNMKLSENVKIGPRKPQRSSKFTPLVNASGDV